MNSDLFRHAPKQPTTLAQDLLHGLEARSFNRLQINIKAKHAVEKFAEDELVRKRCYDEMRCEMPGQPRSTFLMVFSPDGSKVASTHGNHHIYVTDIKSGKHIKTLVGHPRTPWCIAFHPTSNQIVASGCLGGEVRIWDLSGGSEVWTAGNQSVIASIAFHPNDRILVIATYNELYFWDWSRPEPFVQVATANPKEKIRYVAFDKLGQKLITGIANSPQTRWERVRAPIQVPRQAERSASPYRLRITPRLVNLNIPPEHRAYFSSMRNEVPSTVEAPREPVSSVPERERRITASYRNLLKEYEQLVQRYLKVYKPPTMIDRGTDPMEPNATNPSSTTSSTQAPEASSAAVPKPETEPEPVPGPSSEAEPQPSSSSENYSSTLMMPSRILAMKKQPTHVNSTQTTESRKHKSSDTVEETVQEKRTKCEDATDNNNSPNTSHAETATQTQSPRKMLVINDSKNSQPGPSSSGLQDRSPSGGVRILCPKNSKRKSQSTAPEAQPSCSTSVDSILNEPSTSQGRTSTEDLLLNIRPIAEEVRKRFLPIIKSLPACDRPKLIRRFENSRAHERLKFRQMCPNVVKKPNRRPILDTSSDNSSSDDEQTDLPPRISAEPQSNQNETETNDANPTTSTSNAPANISDVRNFIMELEHLLMTVLLTEIDNNDSQTSTSSTANVNVNNNPSGSSNETTNFSSQQPSVLSNLESDATGIEQRSSPISMSANRDRDLIRPSTVPAENSIFQRLIQRYENPEQAPSSPNNDFLYHSSSPIHHRASLSAYTRARRRMSSHRISAFMPTRVNYNRASIRYRRATSYGLSTRMPRNSSLPADELINFSERPNAEDNLPHDNWRSGAADVPDITSDIAGNTDAGLSSMYSNIVQDLETSLNDVRNIRASSRPGETSDMLSSFSESLENIMNQSDTILRNLGGSMSLLPNYTEQGESSRATRETNEPRASFNDQSFYVRDNSSSVETPSTHILDVLRGGRSVVESDHNYPRNPPQNQGTSENSSPLMTSLHLTISYIQRQARLLRQQVESIERIDRAMFEVEQLQLLRQLIMDSLRFVRSLSGESRNTGMSSVRQMMAGTRISDSSPYDSQSEEAAPQAASSTSQPSTSSNNTSEQPQPRPRSSGRKTYPPSRLLRMQRQNRRSLFVNFFPRRYSGRPDRGAAKHGGPSRNPTTSRPPPAETSNPLRYLSSYSLINSSSLNLMARRLEHLLAEQTRIIARPQEAATSSSRSTAPTELGERILSIRLHECALRMNRILGNTPAPESGRLRNPNNRSESVVVTQDGASRFSARHFLSLIVDGMSKHMEELGGSNISQSMRGQIHNVLAMALLLSDLLLLQLVDSIPPPAGMNLDVERESLTSRIDDMCEQMLHNRFSGHSHQLTKSLQHMRQTMRHAYRFLGQTYISRRNTVLSNRQESSRRHLWNRYLRDINWGRQRTLLNPVDQTTSSSDTTTTTREALNPAPRADPPSSATDNTAEAGSSARGWDNSRFFVMRYANNAGDDEEVANSSTTANTRERSSRVDNLSSNNSDDNDDESEWYLSSSSSSRNTALYRTNNVNLVHNNEESSVNSSRPWNVPSVHVNDVPISEQPSLLNQRIMSHRQRLAERVSELRAFPQMSVLRPRFLHPLYASVNPFDADLDDPQRETTYDCDMITTVTPNHRIQMWDISSGNIPVINNPLKNIIVSECKIHNDASVDIAKDGTILVTLLPSGGYLNVTNKLGVYSLRWDNLGQCLYTTSFEQNAVSVALSPLSRHLVVGLASRRVSIVPNDRWTMARIFIIDKNSYPSERLQVLRELGQNRDSRATSYKSVNCIRWLPTSGQGLIYATNTGQLVILT